MQFLYPVKCEGAEPYLFKFEAETGNVVVLNDASNVPLTAKFLQPGWSINLLVRADECYWAALVRGAERAIWVFDTNFSLIAASFDQLELSKKRALENTLVEAITMTALGGKRSFSKEWANNREVLSRELIDPIIDFHISNLVLEHCDHDVDQISESILLLSRETDHDRRRSTSKSIGDTSIFYNALAKRSISVKSPQTGAYLSGDKSIFRENNHLIYPVWDEREFGYLIAVGSSVIFPAFFYVPEARKIYATNRQPLSSEAIKYVRHTVEQILNDYVILQPYSAQTEGKPAGFVFISHIGHHLWNELSGLERAERGGDLSNLSRIYSLWPDLGEHFGKLEQLYPSSVKAVDRIREGHIFPRCIYERNEFVLRLSDGYIPDTLTTRITGQSIVAENVFLDDAAEKLSKCDVIVLVSFRFENRTWINQLEEVIDIGEYALKKGLNLGVVFDGHNSTEGSGYFRSHEEQLGNTIVDKELETVAQFCNHFGSRVEVVNNIGGSVARSIGLGKLCHFFIVPWGAALAKYKWATGTWGILASNRYCLTDKGDRFIYEEERYVERGVPDIWYNPDDVIDESLYDQDTPVGVRDRGNFKTLNGSLRLYFDQALKRLEKE